MNRLLLTIAAVMVASSKAWAFCGFYVATADATLFNKSSQVILARSGNRTVVTMESDFSGDVKDFAMVVPVPVVLKRDDIKVINPYIFSYFDNYSSPRLVEYWDTSPCEEIMEEDNLSYDFDGVTEMTMKSSMSRANNSEKRVKIEAEYHIEEYDILILSAKESDGLESWLNENGYNIPKGANEVLQPYVKNKMKFFVVKVDLSKIQLGPNTKLRPIQISYESNNFMLPIRLGMANANGPQDLIIYHLSDVGRVECSNYRTVEIPTDRNIPEFLQPQFGPFYKDLFDRAYQYNGKTSVFLEYSWDLSARNPVHCDPCNGPPPVSQQLVDGGVFWLNGNNQKSDETVFFTRLHVRYDREHFPQDLLFQATPNKERFQGRYVMQHMSQTSLDCEKAQNYLKVVARRRKEELQELAMLTGWYTGNYYASYIASIENMIKPNSSGTKSNSHGLLNNQSGRIDLDPDCIKIPEGSHTYVPGSNEEMVRLASFSNLETTYQTKSNVFKIILLTSVAVFGFAAWRRRKTGNQE